MPIGQKLLIITAVWAWIGIGSGVDIPRPEQLLPNFPSRLRHTVRVTHAGLRSSLLKTPVLLKGINWSIRTMSRNYCPILVPQNPVLAAAPTSWCFLTPSGSRSHGGQRVDIPRPEELLPAIFYPSPLRHTVRVRVACLRTRLRLQSSLRVENALRDQLIDQNNVEGIVIPSQLRIRRLRRAAKYTSRES